MCCYIMPLWIELALVFGLKDENALYFCSSAVVIVWLPIVVEQLIMRTRRPEATSLILKNYLQIRPNVNI